MKYLRRYLLHAGVCLLLVCSANVASAQLVGRLESVSTTQTSVSRTIDFNFNLSSQLTGDEILGAQIAFSNVLESEIERVSILTNYTISNNVCGVRDEYNFPLLSLCMDAGEQNVTLRLVLNSSFDRRKTIIISLGGLFSLRGITENIERDPDNSVLRYPGPAVFMRIKVFLEGPLQ